MTSSPRGAGVADPKRLVARSRSLRIVFVLLAMWALLAVHPETREAFLSAGNFSNLTAQIAEIVIAGVGMTLVILVGGIDLSVGAGMALAGVLAAKLQIDMQKPAWMAVLAAVTACSALGAWHGVLVTRFAIPPFIATLSGFLAYRGLALVVSDARGLSPMGEDFQRLGDRISGSAAIAACAIAAAIGVALVLHREARRRRLGLPVDGPVVVGLRLAAIAAATAAGIAVYRGGMPVPVAIAGGSAAIGALVLGRTRLGRYAYAIGGNAEAARLSGVPVRTVTIAIYVAMGALTGLAGIVATARTNGVTPGNAGLMRELHVITAVVIGGTSLTGGRGTILGTVIGALVFGTLSNGMNLMGVNSNWQLIATGLILVAASVIDAWSARRPAR
ncbi:MAG: sugar ABC transporter permease [Deltaproteobacteria bacterium]|nr:sugar ABC transporter permease [Deltaproteobacteria bacterium]